MKTLQKTAFIIFLLLQQVVFTQEQSLTAIKQKYNALLQEQNKGIGVLTKKNGQIQSISLGNFQLHQNTVFNIGSATKTFTAVLVLQEMEKGNLQLRDSIGKYLDTIPNLDASLRIEQLLTHESGLEEVIGKNIEELFYKKSDALYQENLLLQLEKSTPEKIGKFNYSNTNYLLLGKILEKITDQSYFDLIRERIIKPLALKSTYAYLHKNIPNLATPYYQGENVSGYLDHRLFSNIAFAAGSIASTLSDMEVFYTSLFETEKLLTKNSVKMMVTSGNKIYGFGIFKSRNEEVHNVSHGGNNIGYAFINAYNIKTKNLFLAFSNCHKVPLSKSLSEDLIAYLQNVKIQDFETLNLKEFQNITGKYFLKEANLTLEIIIENNKMYLIAEEQGIKSELMQKNQDSIYDTTVGATLTKIKGSNDSLTFSQNGFTTTIHKITTKI